MGRKVHKEAGGSLDSLLDTMTNVVGILVIVLIVTQLNVAEALKRITSSLPEVSVEDLQQSKELADQNRETLTNLETTWTELEPDKLKEDVMVTQLKLEVEKFNKENEEVVKQSSDLEELKKLVAEHREKVEKESKIVLAADRELQDLLAMLDETPEREIAAPKVVNLPDPRPAPQNAEPRFVLCKGGKAYYVGDVYKHLFQVREFIEGRFKEFVYRGPGMGTYVYSLQLNKKSSTGYWEPVRNRDDQVYQLFRYDAAKIGSYFEKNKIGGNDLFYRVVKASETADYLALKIGCREEGGAGVEVFKQRNSALDKAFKQVAIERNYLYFYVAPDSFDAYLEARQMAEFHRIPAGWQPWTAEEFSPATKVPRETMEITLDDLPVEDIAAVAKAVEPQATKNRETAEAMANAVSDPAQKVEALKYVQRFVSCENAVKAAAAVAERMRGRFVVRISPQAPNIPLIRIFAVTETIPAGGKAPVTKGAKDTKADDKKPKGDTLD